MTKECAINEIRWQDISVKRQSSNGQRSILRLRAQTYFEIGINNAKGSRRYARGCRRCGPAREPNVGRAELLCSSFESDETNLGLTEELVDKG